MCNGCSCGMNGPNPGALPVLDRRDFLTQSLLATVAGILTSSSLGCGRDLLTGVGATASANLGTRVTVTLANFPALATVGGIARVDGGAGTPLAVARTAAGTFVAVSLVCTHQGTTVDIVNGGFKCPNHGATFGANGHWTGGQVTTNLVAYPVAYDPATGTLQIGGGATTVVTGQPSGGLIVNPALFPALAATGGVARVDTQQPGTTPIAVIRTGSNTWAAFSMVCPHQGTTINIVSGGFLCPNHGARFNTSGANIGGQSSGPLTTLPVTVRTDGMLVVGTGSKGVPSGGSSGGGGSDDD